MTKFEWDARLRAYLASNGHCCPGCGSEAWAWKTLNWGMLDETSDRQFSVIVCEAGCGTAWREEVAGDVVHGYVLAGVDLCPEHNIDPEAPVPDDDPPAEGDHFERWDDEVLAVAEDDEGGNHGD